ncbi:MAG: hypothetical protein JXR41_11665, partial [Bacteroidales bacterium]|nr:hypothetical protein [Bacteroidales bacterium]
SFIKVTSGLGGSLPKNILIVPLNTHDTSVGVIEIASLKTLQPNHIRLMEKASVNIASNLRLIQINKRNAQLLGSFHEKEKELRLREEELHQQLEELQTLKEEVDRYKKMDNKKS